MTETYSQTEIAKIFAHIPARTLAYWAKKGLVKWKAEKSDKRGCQREYDRHSLYQIGLIEELTSINFPLDLVKHSISYLHDEPDLGILIIQRTFPGRSLADTNWNLSFYSRDIERSLTELVAYNSGAASFIVIDLKRIVETVDIYIKRAAEIKRIMDKKDF